jgi:hypothetical protein
MLVRAVAFVAAIVAVGSYLAVAAALSMPPTWIALGVLAISVAGAVTMVVADRPAQPAA